MAASDRQVLDFHARSSGALADLLYENARLLENDFLALGLEPVAPSHIQLDSLPKGADRDSFLAAYRQFDAEYFSFLAACAWCMWHCGLARSLPPIRDTCRRVLDFCGGRSEWKDNIWVGALCDPEKSQLGSAAVENLNIYLALLLDPEFRSGFPRTQAGVNQTFAITEAQKVVWMFVLNAFSDAVSQGFFKAGDRDGLTSLVWTLLDSQHEKFRSAGKSYEARLQSVVVRSLHLAGDSAGFNQRNRT